VRIDAGVEAGSFLDPDECDTEKSYTADVRVTDVRNESFEKISPSGSLLPPPDGRDQALAEGDPRVTLANAERSPFEE
jgi:hypothetical protein